MENFVLSLGLCSVVMSVIALMYSALCFALKNVWSPKRRYIMWIVLFIGFLTPVKPRFGDPVYIVSPVNLQETGAPAATAWDVLYGALFAVWLTGFLSCVAFYALRQFRFYRYTERFSSSCSQSVLRTAQGICEELGVRDARVCVLPGLPSPMLTGFLSPTVLLPHENYAEEELRLILKHELTHFKQHDLFIKLFVLLCRSVHWFNPLMLLFERYVDGMCELTCDARVLEGEGSAEKKIYCKAILSAVSCENLSAFSRKPAIAGTFGDRKLNLRYRLQLIVLSSAKKKLGVLCVFLCALTMFSGAVFGVSYENEQQYVEITTMTAEISTDPYKDSSDDFEYEISGAQETSITIVD